MTIVSGTGERFDPAVFHAGMQPGNAEVEGILDFAENLRGASITIIVPKRVSLFQLAFAVAGRKDLVSELSPSFKHESPVFENF